MQEIWKPIPGFDDLYEVSNLGRVKSVDRIVRGVSKTGTEHIRHRKGMVLSPVRHSQGYLEISLCKFGKPNRRLVHQVVAATFIDKPDGAQCVNHKNGNKHDNRVENLEWCSFSHNVRHANSSGLVIHAKGSQKPLSKLQESDIPEIRDMLSVGIQNVVIAKLYGVAQPTISNIKHGKAWKHVS